MAISVKHPSVLGPDDPTKQVSKNVYEQEHDVTGVAESSALDVLSAQVVSADDAISAAVVALSSQHTSLAASVAGALSAIGANSAQMTSADNVISAAAAAVSADLTSVKAAVSNLASDVAANSAQMTSADNAVSAAVVALSAQHTSLAASVAGALSAIGANSAQMTSADNALSATIAGILTSGQGPIKRVLEGNQIVSATVAVSISGFTFTVSGGVGYHFEFGIFMSSPISLAGSKFVISAPAGAFGGQAFFGGTPTAGSQPAFDSNPATVLQVTVSAVGAPRTTFLRGAFRPTANGTLQLAMGNNVSGAGAGSAITVLAGSYGYVWRLG